MDGLVKRPWIRIQLLCKQCTPDVCEVKRSETSIHSHLPASANFNNKLKIKQKGVERTGEEARMKRWPSYSSLSLISIPWGREAGRISGPQRLRNVASHSKVLVAFFSPSVLAQSSCENASWHNKNPRSSLFTKHFWWFQSVCGSTDLTVIHCFAPLRSTTIVFEKKQPLMANVSAAI